MAAESLSQEFENLRVELDEWKDGLRPSYCTAGDTVDVSTNFVRILKAPTPFFSYSVEFGAIKAGNGAQAKTRPATSRAEKIRILAAAKNHAKLRGKHYAFLPDCTLLVTFKELAVDGDGHVVLHNLEFPKRTPGLDSISHVILTPAGPITYNNSSADLVGTKSHAPTHPQASALLNAVVQHYPSTHPKIVQVGSNRFFETDVPALANAALKPLLARSGYNLTAKGAEVGPGVTINTTTTCFLRDLNDEGEPMLVSEFMESLRAKFPRDVNARFLSHVLRGVQVRVTHNRGIVNAGTDKELNLDAEENRFKFIESFGEAPSDGVRVTAPNTDGQGPTLTAYLKSQYGVTLQKPNLPCVNVGGNPKKNSEKAVWFAPETLSIVAHQPAHSRLQQLFVSNILPLATRGAVANRDRIRNHGLKAMGLNSQGLPAAELQKRLLPASGFELQSDLFGLKGKLLKTPKIVYTSDFSPSVKEASWNLGSVKKFNECNKFVAMNKLAIVWAPTGGTGESQKFEAFQSVLEGQLALHGARVRRKDFVVKPIRHLPEIPLAELQEMARANNVQPGEQFIRAKRLERFHVLMDTALRQLGESYPIVLVLLPNNSKATYESVKQSADLRGVRTQCMIFQKWQNGDRPYVSNVISKLNLKLGGVAHTAIMAQTPGEAQVTMNGMVVMGADVVHLGGTRPEMRGCPSIATVVGSCNDKFATYLASARLQTSLQETIQDMKIMVVQRLRAWKKSNPNRTPTGILFYRDGVSDSQFEAVRNTEMRAIEAAWEMVFANKPLKLNFLVVTKRHATRFYPTLLKKETPQGRGQNVAPGLLVDHTVTHPYRFDFFLQAHQAIQGTARPAHYYVLRNDLQMNANAMAAMTHMLHYVNPRATKGISYAGPTFLADVCCNHCALWMRFPPATQGPGEAREDFYARCLQEYVSGRNWNKEDRLGPWDPKLDEVMFWI